MQTIQLEGIHKVYQTKEIESRALSHIDLSIAEGEFVSFTGPSGCGKTSLLNIIGLIDSPSSGTYYFKGKRISDWSEQNRNRLRKGCFGFIFQSFNLINELTVFANVELPLFYLRMGVFERKARVNQLLERLNIAHKKRSFPQQLSGGQQQRVALARAVIAQPELILADEPTGNLDSGNGLIVMNLLNDLNRDGATILLATHSVHDASFAHRAVQLYDGMIQQDMGNTTIVKRLAEKG